MFCLLRNLHRAFCCLGHFFKKQFRKHKKICFANTNTGTTAKLLDSQNMLTNHLKIDRHLKEKVFPHMRADLISLTAKKDILICAYGARYMKTHRENHFINVTSRLMRDLARLLLEIKKINPEIKNLFECLNPVHYDSIVTAAVTFALKRKEVFGTICAAYAEAN